MTLRKRNIMAISGICAVAVFLLLIVPRAFGHEAHDPNYSWYKSQKMNPAAKKRLQAGFESCCDEGDHFKTRFRLLNDGSKYGAETYEYWKDGKWNVVPPDIIQRKKTPDGQPVLFIQTSTGKELCFIIDEEGI